MSSTHTATCPVTSAMIGQTLLDNCLLLSGSCTPILVRVVFTGDRYGRLDCLVHDQPDPLVEFYDASYGDTPYGYFVSRYFLETLVAQPSPDARPRTGLLLDGGEPRWALNALALQEAISFALLCAYRREQARVSNALPT